MLLEELTLAAFAACNSIRVIAYLPQIYRAATDQHGAAAISYMTWSLFLIANTSTVAYALVNQKDLWMAVCFGSNALCCGAILLIVLVKRRISVDVGSAANDNTLRLASSGKNQLCLAFRPADRS